MAMLSGPSTPVRNILVNMLVEMSNRLSLFMTSHKAFSEAANKGINWEVSEEGFTIARTNYSRYQYKFNKGRISDDANTAAKNMIDDETWEDIYLGGDPNKYGSLKNFQDKKADGKLKTKAKQDIEDALGKRKKSILQSVYDVINWALSGPDK